MRAILGDVEARDLMVAGTDLIAHADPGVQLIGAAMLTAATAELRRLSPGANSRSELTRRWYELQAAYAATTPICDY